VSNAAEDDQATVRATSFGLRSPRTADKRAWRRRQSLGTTGLALLVRGLAERSTRPLVALGSRWRTRARRQRTIGASIVRARRRDRAALGSLRRPVLGLVLTTAALQGPSTQTTLLLVALSRGTVTGADPLWTYTEYGSAASTR